MKRWLCFVLTGVLLVALSGCGNNASALATGQYNNQRITVESHVSTDFAPDGLYGFTQNIIIVRDHDGFFPVDTEGNRLGESAYNMLYNYEKDGRALAQTLDDEWVWLDTTGAVVETASAPTSADTDKTERYDSSETTGVMGDDGSYLFGVKDSTKGEYLTEPLFEWIAGVDDSLNYAVLAEGKHRNVMISPQGEVMLTLPDDCTFAFLQDEHIVCQFADKTYRLANKEGNLLNDRVFTSISQFSNGLAVVTMETKLGLIAADGTIVIEPQINTDQPVDQLTPYIWENYIACFMDGNIVILKIEKR